MSTYHHLKISPGSYKFTLLLLLFHTFNDFPLFLTSPPPSVHPSVVDFALYIMQEDVIRQEGTHLPPSWTGCLSKGHEKMLSITDY